MVSRLRYFVVVVLFLVLPSCGIPNGLANQGEVAPTRSQPAPPTDDPATATANPQPTSEFPSVADILRDDAAFSRFSEVIDSAELAPILNEPLAGPFTVFAPTNNAFNSLPYSLDYILADSTTAGLADFVRQHILGGRTPSVELLKLQSATNLAGDDIQIAIDQNVVRLNDNAFVVVENIEASNGIIHVIDQVLLTSVAKSNAFSAELIALQPTVVPTPQPLQPTMAEILSTAGKFDTFLSTLDNAKLINAFTDPAAGPYTIFAPTDVAFAALPEGTLDLLLTDPSGALRDVLRYHMLAGRVSTSTLADHTSLIPLSRDVLTIQAQADGSLVFNNSTRLTGSDIRAANGVIHIIDHVLLPPIPNEDGSSASQNNGAIEILADSAETASDTSTTTFQPLNVDPSASILDVFTQAPALNQIAALLNSANMLDVLDAPANAPITVFAPTNEALAVLDTELVNQLLINPDQLNQLLMNHLLVGANSVDQLIPNPSVQTIFGKNLSFTRYGELIVINDNIRIVQSDIQTSNGVIHIIDTLLIPIE